MVIVTERYFVIAERVNYIHIDESRDYDTEDKIAYAVCKSKSSNKKSKTKSAIKAQKVRESIPIMRYTITVHYVPVGRTDYDTCQISTPDKKVAESIYRDAVQQYREQNPDAVYLDKIIDKFLGGP